MLTFLIGAAVGAVFGVSAVVGFVMTHYEVFEKGWWSEHQHTLRGQQSRMEIMATENAKFWAALGGGEMTEGEMQVAATRMEKLRANIANGK